MCRRSRGGGGFGDIEALDMGSEVRCEGVGMEGLDQTGKARNVGKV